MAESFAQYKNRLIGYVENDDPLSIQKKTADELSRIVETLSETQLKNKPEGRWSIAEIISHFAEGEIVYSYRIRTALNASGSPIQAYDQNEWIKSTGYLQRDPRLALELFKTLRRANIALIESLSDEKLNSYGIHSERGKESIRDMALLLAGHDRNHLKQIQQLAK